MFKTFPEFGKELRRGFEVHEKCYDCAEFFHGCNGWPVGKSGRCADHLRLPDVMPGTWGQVVPPSRMKGRREPRAIPSGVGRAHIETQPPASSQPAMENPPAGEAREPGKPSARICDCGAPLSKGKRLCDTCRTQNRRKTMREYMRQRRRPVAVDAD